MSKPDTTGKTPNDPVSAGTNTSSIGSEPSRLKVKAQYGTEDKVKSTEIELIMGTDVGKGTFGKVYEAQLTMPEQAKVAVKRVIQDDRYRNRELDIIRILNHPNVLKLRYYFYSTDKRCMYMVFDFMPQTVGRILHHYRSIGQKLPQVLPKLYGFQILRALAYLDDMHIAHRDLKPQNLLVEPISGLLQVCDFGSAKKLHHNEASVAYICSRYYRAPELLLGNRYYTTKIDIWSAACVIAEMLICIPLFRGDDTTDMLVRIFSTLGVPSKAELQSMNPTWRDITMPTVQPVALSTVLGATASPQMLLLLNHMLKYDPKQRPRAQETLEHEVFQELRYKHTTLPSGQPLPPLGF